MRKVRKAGSELMNRSRRSLHDDSRTSVNIQGSESGENESDASFEDPRHGKLVDLLDRDLSIFVCHEQAADGVTDRGDDLPSYFIM